MDAILVVNAGSSSVKFQIFGIEKAGALRRLIKGQLDLPRHRFSPRPPCRGRPLRHP
jgi:acetate kinase